MLLIDILQNAVMLVLILMLLVKARRSPALAWACYAAVVVIITGSVLYQFYL